MKPPNMFAGRRALLKDELKKRDLDSFLITKEANVLYLSGFRGHDAAILTARGRQYFIADSRYLEEAKDTVKGFEIILSKRSMYETIGDLMKRERLKRLGFESMDLPYEIAGRFKAYADKTAIAPVKDLVEDMRIIKDSGEIGLIKSSLRLTEKVFGRILRHIRTGISEASLAAEITLDFIRNGAKPGFDPIVAIDSNASKPHSTPCGRKISKNSYLMIDMGCTLDGYNSDLTRIVARGKLKPKISGIYAIVRDAQAMAIAAIKPGVKIAKIDSIARAYIKNKGFGGYFGHALGHGVGLEVHEKPAISQLAEGLLLPGMVFTVEPAIYIPKVGGIRIEDMVLVTKDGCEVLTHR
ncbi:MAG: Xaa-Pro peptidase family protein [Candidatus Omnitrophota bacterium]|nr:Xaa-Pro peptidase family protein [Candidatus Omnitrophota bacterium]